MKKYTVLHPRIGSGQNVGDTVLLNEIEEHVFDGMGGEYVEAVE